jgi:hypothetical protein
MSVGIIVASVGVAVWAFVVYRAWRRHADLVLLALVLIVLGLIAIQLLAALGIEAPGAWGYTLTGILLLLLWPRGR